MKDTSKTDIFENKLNLKSKINIFELNTRILTRIYDWLAVKCVRQNAHEYNTGMYIFKL
jgi:hypothetical protein